MQRPKTASTFGSRVFHFYTRLACPKLPAGIRVMNPYEDARVRGYVRSFLRTFFADNDERVLVFGINPGRFGGGLTGIMFTDPVALSEECGIENELPRERELSSRFVYAFIDRFGGPRAFYRRFFLTAVCPLGFVRDGNNYNYYDDPQLLRAVTPFITSATERQLALGGRRDHAIVLGMGENTRFVERLNEERGFFRNIHALEHPRYIMQYRRRQLDRYLAKYEEVFALARKRDHPKDESGRSA
jgi:hypothetical protein